MQPTTDTTTDTATITTSLDAAEPRASRRRLLRLAGGAVAGTAAAALIARPAAADNGLTITLTGATLSDEFTKVTYSGSPTDGHRFLFRSDPTASDTATSTALGTVGTLVGTSTVFGTSGVIGMHSGSGNGVEGYSVGGFGLVGRATSGDGARCISDSGVGVTGSSSTSVGVRALAGGVALDLQTTNDDSQHITFTTTVSPPYERTALTSPAGALVFTSPSDDGAPDGGVWICVESGTPGTWRHIASIGTAGSFHPIATARVYDSRKTMTPMTNGILTTGSNRVISVKDQRNTSTGAVVAADIVPAHATAVAYNLTIVTTVGTNGFLGVEPGDASVAGGSAINWSAAGLTLANASVAKLDSSRQLKVFCGGTATSCHFIIDVVGYYR